MQWKSETPNLLPGREVLGAASEMELIESLFARYDSDVRPLLNISHAVPVTFDFALKDVIYLDLRNQVLTTNIWMRVVSYSFATLI